MPVLGSIAACSASGFGRGKAAAPPTFELLTIAGAVVVVIMKMVAVVAQVS